MYYKIEKESELGQKIAELIEKVQDSKRVIFEYLESIGAQETVLKSSDFMTGQIRGLYFNRTPDLKLYSQVRGEIGAYFPRKKTNRNVYDKIVNELPSISRSELDDIVGFKSQFVGFTHCRHVGFVDARKWYLIEVSNIAEYTPTKGMTEILASEWKELCETVKDN